MRAVVQRVSRGRVTIAGSVQGEIAGGLVVLVGVGREDTPESARYLAEKIAHLRIFEDLQGKMNRSLIETGGAALVVSQFTLYGDVRRGRRPGFDRAAPPEAAIRLYEAFVEELRACGVRVETGVFQAQMTVDLANEGPVTILLDSEKTL
ncbi:MAG TPA: D-aminoacyl-tRNA deacylase [Candidatus Dormibacteraeota bacterium]|nr:D-aminoacyl-tRNA deacylase [Candidatus Dormibacteraeota bacterium]